MMWLSFNMQAVLDDTFRNAWRVFRNGVISAVKDIHTVIFQEIAENP